MNGSTKWLGAAAALLVTLALVAGIDPQDPPKLVRLAGRLHPLIVHFPIGLLLLALFLRLLGRDPGKSRHLGNSADLIWDLGALSAVAVALTGYTLSLEGGFGEDLIYWHKRLGISVAVASAGAALVRRIRMRPASSVRWTALHHLLVAVTSISLVATGHLGGTMVQGAGYWSAYLPEPVGRLVDPFAPEFTHNEFSSDLNQARIFPHLVRPLLEANCVPCHGSTRQEAGLRLDSHEALLQGSNRGVVLEAGKPDGSEILRRVTAPLVDQDRMPPSGYTPLGIGETELLRWWIEEGASKELRVIEAQTLPSSVNTLLNRRFGYRETEETGIYAIDVALPDQASIQQVQKAGFGVRRLSGDHPFLQVDATNLAGACNDETLQVLRPLSRQLARLDLSRTAIGDPGLELIASMRHLTRLNLSRTKVGDDGLAQLASLSYLQYLNLYGTQVSDEGLHHLLALPALKTLYLWQTQTSPHGLERFRGQAPGVEVSGGAQLQPVPEEEQER